MKGRERDFGYSVITQSVLYGVYIFTVYVCTDSIHTPERWDKRESEKISALDHNKALLMGNLDDTCNRRQKKCLLLAKKELLYTPCMEPSAT